VVAAVAAVQHQIEMLEAHKPAVAVTVARVLPVVTQLQIQAAAVAVAATLPVDLLLMQAAQAAPALSFFATQSLSGP